jgi:hypothetical protein
MTDDEIKTAQELRNADNEDWRGERGDWTCPGCDRPVWLSPDHEPRGLCGDCNEKLHALVPRLLDEVARMQPVYKAAKAWRALMPGDASTEVHEMSDESPYLPEIVVMIRAVDTAEAKIAESSVMTGRP